MNFSYNEQFPESILYNSIENISCKELLSPKFIPRVKTSKLNLDIPENFENINTVDQLHDDVYPKDEVIHEINNDIDYSELLTGQISPTSEQSESLNKLNEENNTNVANKKLSFCVNNNLLQSTLNHQTNYLIDQVICLSSLSSSLNKLKADDAVNVSTRDNTSTSNIISSHFINNTNKINDKIETHVSMNESSIVQDNSWKNNNLLFRFHWWKVPLVKFYGFSCWLSNKIFKLIKTNYQKFCQFFGTIVTGSVKNTEESNDNITQIISIIKSENERMLLLFTEKFNSIKQELNQVHILNENTLSMLKCELDIVKNTSNKLAQNNDAMTREFTVLSRKLDETIQINSANSLRQCGSILTSETQPPPPPPPPLPPIHLSIPITPKSPNHNRTSRTPIQTSSTPLTQGRPLITAEDLRKVTLKKAPQINKENNPRYNNMETPRGPAISLDMLRSVKLKSARRNRSNADINNVRSPRRALKNSETQSFSLSPIMAGAVSPLSRILKQVDNRRKSKWSLMSPTHSDNDLTKDNTKQFNVTRHSKSSHMIFV